MSSEAFSWNKFLNPEEAAAAELAAAEQAAAGPAAPESSPPLTMLSAAEEAAKLAEAFTPHASKADASQATPSETPESATPEASADSAFAHVSEPGFTDQPERVEIKKEDRFVQVDLPDDIHSMSVTRSKYEIHDEIATSFNIEALTDVKDASSVHVDEILTMAIERKASDIHLTAGLPPMVRLDGDIQALPYTTLTAADTRRLIYDTLNDEQIQKFEQTHELDFGYGVKNVSRFRFNVYMQRGSVAGAMRAIPTKIPLFEDLGLPNIIRDISKRHSGLVLVTGPTGSGKSTTIASMIDDINARRTSHIMTIEDPIEYLHSHKKCMVNQRELHADTYSFHAALRAVLREDPDIILVGELRDLETIEAALTLAETGHLVFGTLHTRNAPSTVDRVIDVFPSDQQSQIRVLLGNTLEGVVSQQLLPRLGGGRIASIEIMLGTPAIKNLIREGKTHQMYSVIETSAQLGMQTMDRSLADIFRQGMAAYEECLMRAVDKENFARLAKGG